MSGLSAYANLFVDCFGALHSIHSTLFDYPWLRHVCALVGILYSVEICKDTGTSSKFYDPNDSYNCEDSTVAIKADDNCGGRIQATNTLPASTGMDITTIVTTKNNDKYYLKRYFELRVMLLFHGAGRSYWTHVLGTVVSVTVVDEVFWIGKSCYLHVDPHAKTTDGRRYEMQYAGMFVLARHLFLPIQIQVITMPCWTRRWRSPTCVCAVVFQAGLDIYLIDHCEGAHFNGFLLAGDGVLDVYENGDTRYKIVLPTTMAVDVYVLPRFGYFMNVDIYPSPAEIYNIVGLCGNFNGNMYDDFQIRDSTNQGSTEDFSLSWELLDTGRWVTESLLEETNYLNPTPWKSQLKLCVCPDAHDAVNSQSIPLCSANEEKTCTKTKSHKGKKMHNGTRPKRETRGNVNLDIAKRVRRLKRSIVERHEIHRKRRGTVPNANRMNETEARRLCNKQFANSIIYNIEDKPISAEPYIEECGLDLMASGDEEWARPHIIALTTRNEIAMEKDVASARNNSQVVAAIEQICTHDCYGHGTCIGNNECLCEPGWGRKSCLLDITVGPVISYITGEGICDTSTDECREFIIETDGVVELFFAKMTVYEAYFNGSFTRIDEYVIEVAALTLNEGLIDVRTGRYRRSTSSDTVVAKQYGVSISNDGVNFGNVTHVTVLDTRCQESTNNNNGYTIVLKAGYCYIDGVCYSEGNSSAANNCQICRTATTVFDWTDENCTVTTKTSSQDDNLRLYAIIFSVLGGVVVIFIIAGLLFFRHVNRKRPVTPLPAASPYRGPTPLEPVNLQLPEEIRKSITGTKTEARGEILSTELSLNI